MEQYLSLYPWAQERVNALVVDVGGGAGGATLPFLRQYGHLNLQVQDLPETEKNFDAFLHADYSDIAESGRATFLAQDFFEPQATQGADVYFLRHILHNWNDSMVGKILNNLTAAMSLESKLLICEHILLPVYASQQARDRVEDNDTFFAPHPLLANWGASFTSRLDLQVLSILDARQRTAGDFERLFIAAGLQKYLFLAGADAKAQDSSCSNALRATLESSYQEYIKLFLGKGADANAENGDYGNSLQATSVGGYQEIVKPLLDKRADVDAQSANTGTGSVTIVPTLSGRVKGQPSRDFQASLRQGSGR
ncbi:unnamed protein product [Penicillium manginii]